MRRYPHLFEANAVILLRRLSEKYNKKLTLGSVPEKEWQEIARRGFDFLWLMGVWQRSPEARKQALQDLELRRVYSEVLKDWKENDVAGSPYAIYSYSLDPSLGREDDLIELKKKLNHLGLSLILDFVPNHLALDHPWTLSHPSRFVTGTEASIRSHPDWFFKTSKGTYLAHGRDPYFPPWRDTVQVNYFSSEMRAAMIEELLRISQFSDGVRCDMAMLVLNNIFNNVWGSYVNDPRPKTEFWPEAINVVKDRRHEFVFLAEAYWNLEWELHQLGFDFTYDKSFYDRLRFAQPVDIRNYLRVHQIHQDSTARFLENHDELRAATGLGRERSMAAAVILSTVPGLRFFHDGQLEGHRLHLPIQLIREPHEETDVPLFQFYNRLLTVSHSPVFHAGDWTLIEPSQAWAGNPTHDHFLSWTWSHGQCTKVVAVNYSPIRSQCRLFLPLPADAGKQMIFCDDLTGEIYLRDPDELRTRGLFVDLGPWGSHVFSHEGMASKNIPASSQIRLSS